MNWLQQIHEYNSTFTRRIEPRSIPLKRQPCPYAVITCMDPRINLAAIGVLPFGQNGEIRSQVRVIRTIGGMAEERSLLAGIHLAGFQEIAVLMHTDCAGCLVWSKADLIIQNMQKNLSNQRIRQFEQVHGKLNPANLRQYLKAFTDPVQAVKKQVRSIKEKPFVPDGVIVHGLVYRLETGAVDIVVNGY